jgi:sec-independent protein translocase protein TatB
VFGIGAQEMVIIGLLLLVVFGPSKLPNMARDLGRFVSEARLSIEEFKEDLAAEEEDGREPCEGRDERASREPEENVRHEDDAVVARKAQRTR